jgi:23S rRNA pseudouridine1911/1915/1917 synthase
MIKVVFEDDSLIVLDKPAGLVVDKSETQTENTLENWLEDYPTAGKNLERAGIVHRLDKDTSGLILIAKTTEALEKLQQQFQERIVKKEYLALVHGEVLKSGRIEGAIGRNPANREKFIVIEEGKEATTEYSPVKQLIMPEEKITEIFPNFNKIQLRRLFTSHYPLFTLVACQPQTGRTHQIRVHLKHIGFPIVSDEKYVGKKTYRLDHRWCPRQFLHAAKISFNHPESGKRLEFDSPLPEDLEKALENLELLN